MATSDKLLTVDQVSEILGVSRVTFYRRLADGTIPPGVKLGPRAVRWRQSTIDDLMDALPTNGRDADA